MGPALTNADCTENGGHAHYGENINDGAWTYLVRLFLGLLLWVKNGNQNRVGRIFIKDSYAEFFMESLTWDSVAISREALLLFSAFLFGCRGRKEEVEEKAEEEEVIGEVWDQSLTEGTCVRDL